MTAPQPGSVGHIGPRGGRFVPEVLMAPIEELEKACPEARADPVFQSELALDASNVAHAWGAGACSRIESAPGKKDHIKMNELLQAAKAALEI